MPAGRAAKKRVRYLRASKEAAIRESLALPPALLTARGSLLKYRARGFSVRPARILEQKRDCSQSYLFMTSFQPYKLLV